jgi:hypothetical protein
MPFYHLTSVVHITIGVESSPNQHRTLKDFKLKEQRVHLNK